MRLSQADLTDLTDEVLVDRLAAQIERESREFEAETPDWDDPA